MAFYSWLCAALFVHFDPIRGVFLLCAFIADFAVMNFLREYFSYSRGVCIRTAEHRTVSTSLFRILAAQQSSSVGRTSSKSNAAAWEVKTPKQLHLFASGSTEDVRERVASHVSTESNLLSARGDTSRTYPRKSSAGRGGAYPRQTHPPLPPTPRPSSSSHPLSPSPPPTPHPFTPVAVS